MASVLVIVVLGVFVEADAAWHQVTMRDTDFTPTHIELFYFAIPVALVGLVLGFIWIHTRVPYFANRVSIPLALMAAGPILIMLNLGLNDLLLCRGTVRRAHPLGLRCWDGGCSPLVASQCRS
ncbi:MAG: methane monooxygenase/ammonia monooxygenase subunit C [Pseudomonadota bacterium]